MIVMLGFAIEGHPAAAISWVLLAIAETASIVAAALTLVDRLPLLDLALAVLSAVLQTVGAGLSPGAVVSNEVLYLWALNAVPLLLDPTVTSWPSAVAIAAAVLPPAWYFAIDSPLNRTNQITIAAVVAAVFLAYLARFVEAHLRHQFYEQQLTAVYHERAVAFAQAQRALVRSIVPVRLVLPLTRWMARGLRPRSRSCSRTLASPLALCGSARLPRSLLVPPQWTRRIRRRLQWPPIRNRHLRRTTTTS